MSTHDSERVVTSVGAPDVIGTTTPAAASSVERSDTVAYDPYAGRRRSSHKLVQAIYLLFGIIEGLIAIRLVLRALGASPEAGFAQFVYGITAPLVAPFAGLFGNPQAGGSVLELHSIVALVVYALVAWLLGKLAWLLIGETRSAAHQSSTSVDTRT